MEGEFSTLMNLLKSCLGTGILVMPLAFKDAGIIVGTVGTFVIAIICAYCVYALVSSAHELGRESCRKKLTYADVAEEAFLNGPAWCCRYSHLAKTIVNVGIFTTYFAVCSLYAVVIASSLQQFVTYYTTLVDLRIYIAALFVPMLLLSYVPSLKYIAFVSATSNVLMASVLAIIIYYFLVDLPALDQVEMVADASTFPSFFCSTVFALQSIGCIMPLENNMINPHKLITPAGVLTRAMTVITILHVAIGFLGYLRFGEDVKGSVILNLPEDEALAQAAQLLLGLSVYGAFGIQFFICLQIIWDGIKHRYKNRQTLADYVLRTVLVSVAILIAILVPNIKSLVDLIGAFFFSIIGLIIPIIIEMVTFSKRGFGKYNWKLVKSGIILIVGLLALVIGTKDAIVAIVNLYCK